MRTSRKPNDTRRTTTSRPTCQDVSQKRSNSSRRIHSSPWIHPSSRRPPRPRFSSAINVTLHFRTLSFSGSTWSLTSKRRIQAAAVSAAAANLMRWIIYSSTAAKRSSFVISAAMWRLIVALSTISIWKSTSPSSYAANVTSLFRKTTNCRAICLRITSASSVRFATRRSSRLCRWSCISRHDTRTKGVPLVVRILHQIATSRITFIASTFRPKRFVASFAVSHARRRLRCIFIFCRITLSSSGEMS